MKLIKILWHILLSLTIGLSPIWAVGSFMAFLVFLIYDFGARSSNSLALVVGSLLVFSLSLLASTLLYGNTKDPIGIGAPGPRKKKN